MLVSVVAPVGASAKIDYSATPTTLGVRNSAEKTQNSGVLFPQILHSTQGNPSIYTGMAGGASTSGLPSSAMQSFSQGKYNGYILELHTEPLAQLKTEIDEERRGITTQLRQTKSTKAIKNLEKQLVEQSKLSKQRFANRKAVINNEQQVALLNLKRSLPSLAVGRQFANVFNGVELNITDKEAADIRRSGYTLWPNYITQINLSDSVPLIEADTLWEKTDSSGAAVTGQGVTIAIVDTGVDYTHPDLGGCNAVGSNCKVAGGYDVINNDSDPMDDHGHGTHVAATAAGNGVLKGVAPDATIYAYKVLNESGSGSTTAVIEGVERAMDPNGDGDPSDAVDVINLSLGGWGSPDDPISTAVNNAMLAGTVVAVAAGNSGPSSGSVGSPGMAREVITVGASTKVLDSNGKEELAYFSSRGPVSYNKQTFVKPDITAPGVGICAAQHDNYANGSLCLDSEHIAISGTSMATPHVAGAAALLKQLHPDWSAREIKAAFKNTASNLGVTAIEQGSGRIDVLKAAAIPNHPTIVNIQPILSEGQIRNIDYTVQSVGGGQIFLSYAPLASSASEDAWVELFHQNYGGGFEHIVWPLDTFKMSSGDYVVRVVAKKYDGQEVIERAVDYGYVSVKNVTFVSPLDSDVIRAGDVVPVDIRAVAGLRAKVTSIEYGSGYQPTSWTKIRSLKAWDTRGLSTGWYSLNVTVTYGSTIEQSTVHVYLDSTLKEGWPVRLPFEDCADDWFPAPGPGCKIWGGYATPVVSDINGKGKKEIIAYVGGKPPKLYAFSDSGKQLWVSDVGTGAATGGNLHIPLVIDVDGDGKKEIFVTNQFDDGSGSNIYGFDARGKMLAGWPRVIPSSYSSTIAAADLDRDGRYEIIIHSRSWEDYVTVLRSDGTVYSDWQLSKNSWGADHESTPAVGNFDDDEDLEIVIVRPSEKAGGIVEDGKFVGWNNDGEILVFNMDGSLVDGWPVITQGIIFSSPAIGDLDKDGREDIVVGLQYASEIWPDYNYGGLAVFDRGGNMLPGWPARKGYNFWSSPSLADLDNDGDLEVVGSSLGLETAAFESDGTFMPGWPKQTGWNDYYSTIISDVDADDKVDVLTTAGGISVGGGVYAWDAAGIVLPGFPKITEQDAQAPATVADIDNDGKVEIVASSDWDSEMSTRNSKYRSSIYVWELDGTTDGNTLSPWPTFHRDNERSGRYLGAEPTHWRAAPGDVVKAVWPDTLYFVGYDGKRYAFLEDGVTFRSWYKRDPKVIAITDEELSYYPLSGITHVRPGTRLVKIETDPHVYAVSPGGVLHWIETDDVGERLYGTNWRDRIVTLPDDVMVQYTVGEPLTMSSPHPDGTVFNYAGSHLRYVMMNGQRRLITDRGMRENQFQLEYFVRGISEMQFAYPDGAPVTGLEPVLFAPGGSTN